MPRRSSEEKDPCENLYRFIRLRVGKDVSDREIARRWQMEWKSFNALKYGRRQVPRIADLEQLALFLSIDPAFIFEVARGVPAEKIHRLLEEEAPEKLSHLLMAGVYAAHRREESKEQGFKLLLDRLHEGVFTADIQGRFQDVNVRWCELTGFSRAELLEKSLFDLLLPAERPDLAAAAAAVYKDAMSRQATFTVKAKDGSSSIFELGLSRIEDAEGNAVGIQGIARDVTDRKSLEREVRHHKATLETTFEAVPAACLLFANDGTILLANKLVENVCEWSAEEVAGKNAFDVFGNPGPAACPVTRAFQTGKTEQQVSRVKNRRGEVVFVHRTAGPVLDALGNVDKVVEILVDVSEELRRGHPDLLALWGRELGPEVNQYLADVEKRRYLRVPLELPVTLRLPTREARGRVHNVGRGGVFVTGVPPVQVGTSVALEWVLPGKRRSVKTTGLVVRQEKGKGQPGGIGIQFSELSAPQRAAIAAFVMSQAKPAIPRARSLSPRKRERPTKAARTRAGR